MIAQFSGRSVNFRTSIEMECFGYKKRKINHLKRNVLTVIHFMTNSDKERKYENQMQWIDFYDWKVNEWN